AGRAVPGGATADRGRAGANDGEKDGGPQTTRPHARRLGQYRQSAQCPGARQGGSCGRDGTSWRLWCAVWALWRAAASSPGSGTRLSATALLPAPAAARLVSAAAPAVGTMVAPVAAV